MGPEESAAPFEGRKPEAQQGRSPLRVDGSVIALIAAVGFLLFALALYYASTQSLRTAEPPLPNTVQADYGLVPIKVGVLSEGLKSPLAVAVSPQGEVFVADGDCRCIRVFDKKGALKETLGPQVGDGDLQYPVALAVDREDLYVSDLTRARVFLFTNKVYAGVLDKPEMLEQISSPVGLLVKAGRIYIDDVGRHQVLVFDLDSGSLVKVIGRGKGSEVGQLAYANHSLLLPNGNLVVADSNNNRLQVFDPTGTPVQTWYGPLNVPRGIVADRKGNIHVANTLGHRIETYGPSGEYLGGYAEFQGSVEEFAFPTGLAVDGDTIYIADRGNSQVQIGRWQP